jgi:hypothetical protein
MVTNLYVGRRGRIQDPADPRDLAIRDALDAIKANNPKRAEAILAAAIEGTYEPEDDGELASPEQMEAEGLPRALAEEISEQAKTNPAQARSSLRHARARLGTTNAYLPPAGVRARVEIPSPYLPWGGRQGAA